jgi:hypothetical protein
MVSSTETLVSRLSKAHVDRLKWLLTRTDDRRKFAAINMDMDVMFRPATFHFRQAARFVWTHSAAEFARQEVDADHVHLWTAQVVEFLACQGPRPLALWPEEPMPRGQTEVTAESPIDYSPAWWADLRGRLE